MMNLCVFYAGELPSVNGSLSRNRKNWIPSQYWLLFTSKK